MVADYDYALHLGQAPGIGRIQLEAIGINVGGHHEQTSDQFQPLIAGGPPAYQSSLPLADWAAKFVSWASRARSRFTPERTFATRRSI